MSQLDNAICAATERPAVARTRKMIERRGWTTEEWDWMVAGVLAETDMLAERARRGWGRAQKATRAARRQTGS